MAQLPVNPKDWSFLPETILAIAFLAGIGIWAAKQLGIVKKDGNGAPKKELTSGDQPLAYWEKHFERIEEKVDTAKEELVDAVRDLTKAINDLTMTLLRGK